MIDQPAHQAHRTLFRRALQEVNHLRIAPLMVPFLGLQAVTGACLALQKQHFMKTGGFDEVNLRVACNDVNLCFKLIEAGLATPRQTRGHGLIP